MKLINLHTHKFVTSETEIHITNQYPSTFDNSATYFSIGIHPWKINETSISDELQIIASKILDKNCLAIGECGLDKRIDTPINTQITVFEQQLLVAQKVQKPVIVHCVAAFQELIEIKNRLNITVPIVVHGFSKNQQQAQQLLDQNFYLSLGKHLILNDSFTDVLATIPLNRLFLETDSSDFLITDIYQKVSKSLSISNNDLIQKIFSNFKTVFKT